MCHRLSSRKVTHTHTQCTFFPLARNGRPLASCVTSFFLPRRAKGIKHHMCRWFFFSFSRGVRLPNASRWDTFVKHLTARTRGRQMLRSLGYQYRVCLFSFAETSLTSLGMEGFAYCLPLSPCLSTKIYSRPAHSLPCVSSLHPSRTAVHVRCCLPLCLASPPCLR